MADDEQPSLGSAHSLPSRDWSPWLNGTLNERDCLDIGTRFATHGDVVPGAANEEAVKYDFGFKGQEEHVYVYDYNDIVPNTSKGHVGDEEKKNPDWPIC